MPKHFVRTIFDRWLAHSDTCCRHPPHLVIQRKAYFLLEFLGITPHVCCHINTWGMVEIRVIYQRTL
jgi:hypothetical protein